MLFPMFFLISCKAVDRNRFFLHFLLYYFVTITSYQILINDIFKLYNNNNNIHKPIEHEIIFLTVNNCALYIYSTEIITNCSQFLVYYLSA